MSEGGRGEVESVGWGVLCTLLQESDGRFAL